MPLQIRDVMTSEPSTASPTAPLQAVAREIVEERYSGLPVVEDGRLVGTVEVGDLLPQSGQVPFTRVAVLEFHGEWLEEDEMQEYARALREMTVSEVMARDPPTVSPGDSVGAALAKLVEAGVRRLTVVDDERVVGIVTRTDLLRAFTEGV